MNGVERTICTMISVQFSTMSRFEKRITDEQVASARVKIAEGATYRAAAAEIPCAPSGLWYRIKQAERAETPSRGLTEDSRPPKAVLTPSGGDGAGIENVGPLEILREALHATKMSGQPDWTTRLAAARTLAALRPQELEPKQVERPLEPEIVVFDLPPGSNSVIHRARESETKPTADDAKTTVAADEAPIELPQPTSPRLFFYRPEEGTMVRIGEWSPRRSDVAGPHGAETVTLVTTAEQATADLWREELAAGRLPRSADDS